MDERNKVLVSEEIIKIVTVGIKGDPGAGLAFNDDEGQPADVSLTASNDGTSHFVARRDHTHRIDVVALDSHVANLPITVATSAALALKADKTYVDTQDAGERSARVAITSQ